MSLQGKNNLELFKKMKLARKPTYDFVSNWWIATVENKLT